MILKILLIIAIILASIMTLYSLYYVYVAINFFNEKKVYPDTDKYNKFAILVAARNEEKVIGNLVESLLGQDYPKDRFDVIVMPNNCKDDTKGAAERAGALTFEPPLPVKSKGEVLHQTFDYLLKEKDYDAFIIFDADNLADKNFVKEMNKALEAGYGAATGLRDSKNPYKTYMSSSYTLFYLIFDVFYNGARSALGMNCLITGTGFMISREILEAMGGWNTYTITEDVELTLQLSCMGQAIAYVPRAITYDEQPEDNKQAWNQRLRWSIGSQQNFKLMGRKLLDAHKHNKGKNVLDMYIMLLATYMQIYGFLVGIFGLVVLFFTNFNAFLFWAIFSVAGLLLVQALISVLCLRFLKKPIRPMLKGILTIWWFTLSWIPIHIIALFNDDIEWEEIEHKG